MYLKRNLTKLLFDAIATFPAVLLTGARQSGKTTLLQKQLSEEYKYVLLDDLDLRLFAREDPQGFLTKYSPPVIFDEIQNSPDLLPYIKTRIEQDPKPGNWILTGSQIFSTMNNVSESLSGRIAILNLYSLAINEKHNQSFTSVQLEEYINSLFSSSLLGNKDIVNPGNEIISGFYPELGINKKINKSLWYSSYIQTYLERDVRDNINYQNLNDFGKFLKLLASRTGNELNYSALSKQIGMTVPTIKKWISILEASYVIYLLKPYSDNFGKRIVKSPKIYFLDPGLAAYLVGLQSADHLLNGPMAGALFETLVVSNFVKMFSAFGMQPNLYYWRSVSGLEIDLIIDFNGELIPIEIKLTATITPKQYKNLSKWKLLVKNVHKGLIVSQSHYEGRIGPDIYNIHWTKI